MLAESRQIGQILPDKAPVSHTGALLANRQQHDVLVLSEVVPTVLRAVQPDATSLHFVQDCSRKLYEEGLPLLHPRGSLSPHLLDNTSGTRELPSI